MLYLLMYVCIHWRLDSGSHECCTMGTMLQDILVLFLREHLSILSHTGLECGILRPLPTKKLVCQACTSMPVFLFAFLKNVIKWPEDSRQKCSLSGVVLTRLTECSPPMPVPEMGICSKMN
jgi:hypothetical protein